MLRWEEQFRLDTASLGQEEKLLGMDNHGAQQTLKFRAALASSNTIPAYTPPECTDCVAPPDHHVGARVKELIGVFYRAELEDFRQKWMEDGLSSPECRMKMVTWAAGAWQIVKAEADFLRSAFLSTGFLVAKDGSEMSLIKIKGAEEYDYTA